MYTKAYITIRLGKIRIQLHYPYVVLNKGWIFVSLSTNVRLVYQRDYKAIGISILGVGIAIDYDPEYTNLNVFTEEKEDGTHSHKEITK